MVPEMLKRTHMCGLLRKKDVEKTVVVSGWVQRRRDLGGLIFVDLRDRTGLIQIVFDRDISQEAFSEAEKLGSEFVIAVKGKVYERQSVNLDLPTGKIEIFAEKLIIYSVAETPPIYIKDGDDVSENLRLQYRYLDLRKPSMQKNLIFRSQVANTVRDFFVEEDFIEIETPMLINTTPEGARDYLVPSRVNPGRFYALPQSPQLFKQLLMVSGMERYFQIVKCFRDEDLRADRQPEFTQIDCEMSFVDMGDVININERLMKRLFKEVLGLELEIPIQKITYKEAMERYGSDKPDIRFGMELEDITDIAGSCSFRVFSATVNDGGVVKGINVESGASFSRREISELEEMAKYRGAKGMAWIRFTEDGIVSPIAKFFTEGEMNKIVQRLGAKTGDLLLFVADKYNIVCNALGYLRAQLGKRLNLYQPDDYKFLWVTEFPMFEYDDEAERFVAMHHPFTAPKDEDIELLDSNPARVRSKAYDIILNGHEIGGGSIRITSRQLQEKIFKIMGLSHDEIQKRFAYLLDAFKYGTPPHGGIAYGLDRLVMILAGESNIRQVIAFPKTQNATCLMTKAPTKVEEEQLNELHIKEKTKS